MIAEGSHDLFATASKGGVGLLAVALAVAAQNLDFLTGVGRLVAVWAGAVTAIAIAVSVTLDAVRKFRTERTAVYRRREGDEQ